MEKKKGRNGPVRRWENQDWAPKTIQTCTQTQTSHCRADFCFGLDTMDLYHKFGRVARRFFFNPRISICRQFWRWHLMLLDRMGERTNKTFPAYHFCSIKSVRNRFVEPYWAREAKKKRQFGKSHKSQANCNVIGDSINISIEIYTFSHKRQMTRHEELQPEKKWGRNYR